MKNDNPVLIVDGFRTPIGSFQGSLRNIPAPRLGAVVLNAVVEKTGIKAEQIDEVIMGNVLTSGLGQAPARQAAIFAGFPNSVECLTINKMCGSGLKAVMIADQVLRAGGAEIILAGGMENMTLAPYIIPKARTGLRLGHSEIIDSVLLDGLHDPYYNKHMGSCAETCVEKYQFSRERQDAYALETYHRAAEAQEKGNFLKEIVPVEINEKGIEPIIFSEDEEPKNLKKDKISKLSPVFKKGGTITAANASKINDGAAALLVVHEKALNGLGIKPRARIVAHASFAQDPEWFTTAPIGAIQKVLKQAKMSISDIELFEINEAFSAVAMAAIEDLSLDPANVNVHGGAVALGHPIGASGARLLVTLLHAMEIHNKSVGCVAICLAGGEAASMIIEKV